MTLIPSAPRRRSQARTYGRYVLPAALFCCALAACGGSGGDGDGGGTPPPTGGSVTVSGEVTFDRVPFAATVGDGLDFDSIAASPARGLTVEILDSDDQSVITTTATDDSGNYSASVPQNRSVRVRVLARMRATGAPAFELEVRDNTSGDALYVLDGAAFDTGTADSTRNLNAASGWGGSGYTGVRAAAPFAILDTLYRAKELVIGARSDIDLGSLTVFWSEQNRDSDLFCPEDGSIMTTLYITAGTDDCAAPSSYPAGIYLLGDYQIGDTDEFDQHVIAHEFGHYLENELARSDSIGGSHSLADVLDPRVAFSEGWGNAFAGMVLNDPVYRDSFRDAQGQFDVSFDLEADTAGLSGWYYETTVHEFLWDVFDGTNDDGVALGFGPILDALTDVQRTTEALTTIYPMAQALADRNSAAAGAIAARLAADGVTGEGPYGAGETVWPPSPNPVTMPVAQSDVLPIYSAIGLHQQVEVCGVRAFGRYHKLSNRRFLQFSSPQQRLVSIRVIGLSGTQVTPEPDPDFILWRAGGIVTIEFTDDPPTEEEQFMLDTGDYVLEVYDYSHIDASVPPRNRTCMTVSVTG
jgi:hypothetical protein